jgi:hypothetical protein
MYKVIMSMRQSKVSVQIEKAQSIIDLYTTAVIYPGPYPVKTSEVGSGTFISIAGKKGILTNWHVADIFISRESNCIVVPYLDTEGRSLAIESIVYLPPQSKNNYPDMAFIEFQDSSADEWMHIMHSLKKQFFDFDSAKIQYVQDPLCYKKQESSLWLIHGLVAEGMTPINNRATLYYKNSNPYIVAPDLEHVEHRQGACKSYCIFEVDLIRCPILVENRKYLPRKFRGMSGAALWRISFDQDRQVDDVGLVGLATVQDPVSDSLICQGPIALYKTFYEFMRRQYNMY